LEESSLLTAPEFDHLREGFDRHVLRVIDNLGPISAVDISVEISAPVDHVHRVISRLRNAGKIVRCGRRDHAWNYRALP
jgi:hypothetical protein